MVHAVVLLLAAQPILGRSTVQFAMPFSEPPEGLKTREQVRDRFGWRLTSGVEQGRAYDEVRYHGNPYDYIQGPGRGMLFFMTLGMSELILTPCDLCWTARDVLVGYKIRFYYDEANQTTRFSIDGGAPHELRPGPFIDSSQSPSPPR
jgi:hypothetical protein